MTFTINRSQLAKELALLQSAAERKVTIPVLATVLTQFDGQRCQLTVSDCSVTMQTEVEASGESWSGCIPLRQFAALSKLFEEDAVTVAPLPKNRVEVKYGQSRHVLPMFKAEDFPETDKVGETVEIAVNGDALREGLRRVLPCVMEEEKRYAMQGVSFEFSASQLQLVATNGYRLAAVSLLTDGNSELKLIVPPVGLNALLNLEGDVAIKANDKYLQFLCGTRNVTTRLLIGTFPEWRLIIPSNPPYRSEFSFEQLVSALRRAAVTRQETFKVGAGVIRGGVRLEFSSNTLKVATKANDKGESEESISAKSNINGETIPIGFNPDYWEDFIPKSDIVCCDFSTSTSQVLLTCEGDDSYRYIIAPMRLE